VNIYTSFLIQQEKTSIGKSDDDDGGDASYGCRPWKWWNVSHVGQCVVKKTTL